MKKKIAQDFVFEKRNYQLMIVGLLFIAIGFVLMSGGGSDTPVVLDEIIYNFRRIRVAPTLVLIGFGVEIWAILAKPSK